ncbi:MAG: OprD family outer membrane porin [Helicobacteraceae bacterium]|nr:OprD family outer membrane porin [Helicobacteraceae bacterium]
MKKQIVLSAALVALLGSTNIHAAENLSTMFSEGKTSGQIRSFWVDREYQGTAGNTTHRDGWAVGGHLKYETADYEGLSFGTAFYTSNALDISSNRADYLSNDMTLLGPDNKDYSFIGEAYAQYKRGNTVFKAGRQKIDSPMAGTDDARMVPNLFEGYLLINKDIQDTTIVAGHMTKFAQGTFGRVYANTGPSILAVTSGYSYVNSMDHVGRFVNMGEYAVGQNTDGVSIVSATYTGVENLKVQLWDYYAHDILNAIYGEINYSWKCLLTDMIKPSAGVQVIKENAVGDKHAGDVDSLYVAGKINFNVENFNLTLAYSQTGKNNATESALNNAIITPWGGMPAYTQGMVTRHMFLAGTDAMKVAGSYNFKDMGADLKTVAYYAEFDMDANSGYGIARTASEAGFDVIYYPELVKNLQLRARGNFPRTFAEGATGTTGWSEYRLIANYNF